MTNTAFQIRRAGPLAGPAPSLATLLLALLLLLSPATAQQPRERVAASISGVNIGTNLDEAQPRLDRLGQSGGRATRDGGRKVAWQMKETEFSYLALRADKKGKIVWISGFLRPGKELPFSALGDLKLAQSMTASQAIWNVETPEGGYRLVAKGLNGKATVVYLLSLASPPIE
jgi:hypothetical protein